ncbi:MAG: hypothetical protein WCR45_02990 [Bacteroidaceae bacterium]|nr:hypothetical protein [Bacteroidaceae bacterium]
MTAEELDSLDDFICNAHIQLNRAIDCLSEIPKREELEAGEGIEKTKMCLSKLKNASELLSLYIRRSE